MGTPSAAALGRPAALFSSLPAAPRPRSQPSFAAPVGRPGRQLRVAPGARPRCSFERQRESSAPPAPLPAAYHHPAAPPAPTALQGEAGRRARARMPRRSAQRPTAAPTRACAPLVPWASELPLERQQPSTAEPARACSPVMLHAQALGRSQPPPAGGAACASASGVPTRAAPPPCPCRMRCRLCASRACPRPVRGAMVVGQSVTAA